MGKRAWARALRAQSLASALLALWFLGVMPARAEPAATDDRFGAEIAMLRRVNRVAWPILVAATPRCERLGLTGATIGIAAVNIVSFPPERRAWARTLLNLGLRPKILFVPERTPAYDAGIRDGDAIMAVNGAAIAETEDSPADLTRRIKDAIKIDAPIRLEVSRDGRAITTPVRSVSVCRLAIQAADSAEIEASFKGERAVVTSGLARFAADDGDLGLLLAHAFAHVILEAESPDTSSLRFNNAGSPAVERAADTLSLELAAAAGYPTARAAELWERLRDASPAPSRTSMAALHPITPERLAALRAIAAPVRASQLSPTPTR
ncbi:MAG: PDZ domain-containing protein [Alphaproteobacteria bacterium]|nr:PDZ domain-containing protein [Alphaproteobacteria bacterium]